MTVRHSAGSALLALAPRLTADQHKRAVYSATAENAVEFTDA